MSKLKKKKSAPQSSEPKNSSTDILGIVSIVLALVGIQLVGLILGLVGASKAKKEGRSPVLSRIGWILNLVFGILSTILITLIITFVVIDTQASNRNENRVSELNNLELTLENYYQQNGNYPSNIKDLGRLVDLESLQDEKGNDYVYDPLPIGCEECVSYTLTAEMEETSLMEFNKTYQVKSFD